MNIRGQTGLNVDKQFQIEDFIKANNCDIVHLQAISNSSDQLLLYPSALADFRPFLPFQQNINH